MTETSDISMFERFISDAHDEWDEADHAMGILVRDDELAAFDSANAPALNRYHLAREAWVGELEQMRDDAERRGAEAMRQDIIDRKTTDGLRVLDEDAERTVMQAVAYSGELLAAAIERLTAAIGARYFSLVCRSERSDRLLISNRLILATVAAEWMCCEYQRLVSLAEAHAAA